MAYLGNGPLLGAYTHVDDISSGFNGTDVTFNLTKNSVAKYPVRAENILVSIDGVFQEPYEAYDVQSNTITFTEAPGSGSSFFGIILGNVLNIGAIPDGSVTVDKMAAAAIAAGAIIDGAVTTSKIADSNVTEAKLADGSVTTDKLADDSVTTNKIVDANVTEPKLADDSVSTDKIVDGAVTLAKLDSGVQSSITASSLPLSGGTMTGDIVMSGNDITGVGSIDVDNINHLIPTPSITSPANGATNVGDGSSNITFTGSDYFSLYSVSQGGIELQISTSTDFSSPHITETGTGVGTSISTTTGPGTTLATSTTYYARIRYKDSNDVYSNWSDAISFTTATTFAFVQAPSITAPSNGATGLQQGFEITTSAFASTPSGDTHASTDWQISTVSDFSSIVEQSMDDASNLTSYTVTATLTTSTTYYIRVRHTGSSYGDSDWSSTISVTTASVFQGQATFTTDGYTAWTIPEGVTSISAVVIAGGGQGGPTGGAGGGLVYCNNISVTPGCTLGICVGEKGGCSTGHSRACPSYIQNLTNSAIILCASGGGTGATQGSPVVGTGNYGGIGGTSAGGWAPGAGAAGYFCDGCNACSADGNNGAGASGTGEGEGLCSPCSFVCRNRAGGLGSQGGTSYSMTYGGGGKGATGGSGGQAGIRIVWPGTTYQYPTCSCLVE